jgi:uncharacterized protein YutD
MQQYRICDIDYELIEDKDKAFDLKEIEELYTDYFEPYDYILGDYAYSKLRLKGFYDEKNKKVNKVNNYKDIENYIKKYCAYNCKYYILKKIKNNIK